MHTAQEPEDNAALAQRLAQTLKAQRTAYLAHPVPSMAERIADRKSVV